jgi:hypothetical protein
MHSRGGNSRIRIQATLSSAEFNAAPPGFRWPVVLRLGIVCFIGLPLIGDPRTLSWDGQAFWLLMVLACVAAIVQTLRLAYTGSRLRVDRTNARLICPTAFGFQKQYSCSLRELQLGTVELLRSDEGDDGLQTYCLQLHFGPQLVQAFPAHDETDLQSLRATILDWIQTNTPHAAQQAVEADGRASAQPAPPPSRPW